MKELIIRFPDEEARSTFIGRFDYMIDAPMDDGLEDQIDQILFFVPDKEGNKGGSHTELSQLFFNRVPFGKTFKEVHGWW